MKRLPGAGPDLILLDPTQRYRLFARRDDDRLDDGAGVSGGGTATAEIAGEADDKEAEKSPAESDWRDAITDEAARAFAESSTDITHLARRGVEMREKLSRAVFVPGRESGAEEIAAFNKAMGVPDSPDVYRWPALPDGAEPADEVKALRAEWSQFFFDHRFTRGQAETALAKMMDINARLERTRLAADKAFADEQEALLRAEWPGDEFGRNREMANRAARQLFGEEFATVAGLETKDGRLLMDSAVMARAFARLGREMAEGGMNVPMHDTDPGSIDDEIESLRGKQAEANASGDRRLADRFYQEEMALIQKRDGKKGLVGSDGRAV